MSRKCIFAQISVAYYEIETTSTYRCTLTVIGDSYGKIVVKWKVGIDRDRAMSIGEFDRPGIYKK